MENPFERNIQLNVVEEVGRDPLRIPKRTPVSESVETAKRLLIARRRLMLVLPQLIRVEIVNTDRSPDVILHLEQ